MGRNINKQSQLYTINGVFDNKLTLQKKHLTYFWVNAHVCDISNNCSSVISHNNAQTHFDKKRDHFAQLLISSSDCFESNGTVYFLNMHKSILSKLSLWLPVTFEDAMPQVSESQSNGTSGVNIKIGVNIHTVENLKRCSSIDNSGNTSNKHDADACVETHISSGWLFLCPIFAFNPDVFSCTGTKHSPERWSASVQCSQPQSNAFI